MLDTIGKVLESSNSSDIQPGALENAEFGVLLDTELVVAHGSEPPQVVAVVAVQLAGKAGATTASKF